MIGHQTLKPCLKDFVTRREHKMTKWRSVVLGHLEEQSKIFQDQSFFWRVSKTQIQDT